MAATKTSRNTWKAKLKRFLKKSRKPALIGIGQELRGDDAAGILLLRKLQETAAETDAAGDRSARETAPFLFEAGPLPEACSGPLRRFGPDRVIFFDAAEMGEAPGTVRWITSDQLESRSGGTHTFPVGGFSAYLETELGCRVAILGIQPKHLIFDESVSDCVQGAINEIFSEIINILGKIISGY
jgi:hydrogenase 3 maturation protease